MNTEMRGHRRFSLTLIALVALFVQVLFVWTLFHHQHHDSDEAAIPRRNAIEGVSNSRHDTALSTATPCPSCASCSPMLTQPSRAVDTHREVPLFHLTITVFTYNRLNGLQTLLKSLVQADYLGRNDITLRIFLDFPKKTDMTLDGTRAFLDTFQWPHGVYHLHRRLANNGLKKTIMESWYPTRDDEVAAFFEDDIEVSPVWFKWVDGAMRKYFMSSTRVDSKMLGLSLYRPIHDELSGRDVRLPTIDGAPYILQQPCSWGAVYFPKPWRRFRNWYDDNSKVSPSLSDPENPSIHPSSNTWPSSSSWKKYLIKLMYDEGWFMVYPNFPDRMVLSTNHLLPGVHNLPPRKLFELPLVPTETEMTPQQKESLSKLPDLNTMRAYDVMFTDVGSLRQLHGYHG